MDAHMPASSRYTLIKGNFWIHYPDHPRQGPEPDGDIPVGQVYVGLVDESGRPESTGFLFNQGREAIKRRAVTQALALLRRHLAGM